MLLSNTFIQIFYYSQKEKSPKKDTDISPLIIQRMVTAQNALMLPLILNLAFIRWRKENFYIKLVNQMRTQYLKKISKNY